MPATAVVTATPSNVIHSVTPTQVVAAVKPTMTARQMEVSRMVSKVSLNIFDTPELPPITRLKKDDAQHGIKPTTYKGSAYRASDEDTRLCIIKRESRGTYSGENSTGKYKGAYQVNDELAVGMTYHIRDSLIEDGLPESEAKDVSAALREKPINMWSREWQDMAFWTTFNHEGKTRSGASHWGTFGQTHECIF